MIEPKQAFAARLEISPGRLSQLVARGLPVLADGRIDVMKGATWVILNLDRTNGRATLMQADLALSLAMTADAAAFVVGEAPVAAIMACADAGIPRAVAEEIADSLLALLAAFTVEELDAGGIRGVKEAFHVPHPDTWRRRVNWPIFYGDDGQSLVRDELRAKDDEAEESLTTGSASAP